VLHCLTVRSFLPGRVRFAAPVLTRLPELASALQADLIALPDVTHVSASAITGGILIQFSEALSVGSLEHQVREALLRQLECLQTRFTGHATSATSVMPAPPSPLRRLLASTDRHKALRRRTAVLSIVNGLEDLTPSLLVGLAADTVTRGSTSLLAGLGFKTVASRLFALGGFSAGLWLASAVIEYLTDRAKADLANAVRHDLRVALYDHIQSLDIGYIESREVSDWMAIIEADVNQVHSFIRQGINPFFGLACNLVIVGGTFVLISPGLALAQLAMAPPLIIASKALLGPIRKLHMAARDDGERMSALLSGNLAGISTIASFNRQRQECERVQDASKRFTSSMTKAEQLEAIYVPTLRAIAGAGFVTSVTWGSARVAAGTLSAGALNTMALTQLRLLSALGRLGYGLDQYQRTANALERVYATLDRKPEIQTGSLPVLPTQVRGDIRLTAVSFGYQPTRPILHNVSMHFPAGATVGIVGPSGAGKSTVMKLLLRFYDPQHGQITLDGRELRNLQVDDLRESISLVSQQVTLFACTIHDNIAYGRRDASREDVVKAAKIAEAHDFIMALPDQYETTLGFGGFSLSGGQRQRLAVARAVLADRPIVLFDEATSALDFETEASMQRSLQVATAGRTTVMIAHRLSTIRHADIIYVLGEGIVRESGTHDALLALKGVYAGMWMVQTGERAKPLPKKRLVKPHAL
jgi:ATP-binding cassette, subfamily B, bacterial